MILRDKIIFWLLAIFTIFWFLGAISSILIPFLTAIIIAYFLDPLADKIEEKYKVSRTFSSFIILSIFITVLVVLATLFIPLFHREFVKLINAIPVYSNLFLTDTYPKIVTFFSQKGYEIDADFKHYLSKENLSKIFKFSDDILGSIMQSGITVINILSLIFITPILVFYLLKDWNLLVDNVNNYLPKRYANKIRVVFIKIDRTLSGYVRGQFNVCLILGIIYALGLIFIGLNFGFVIGFLTGLISFIPYIGMLIGVSIALVVGFFQWGLDVTQISLVALVFIIGQIIESNFLTPKLVGKKIGLHPVWVIFAVFAFGILFGFIGVLLSVPMAAILGVIIKFLAGEYKKAFVIKNRKK